jgi:hypothetical protein
MAQKQYKHCCREACHRGKENVMMNGGHKDRRLENLLILSKFIPLLMQFTAIRDSCLVVGTLYS